MKVLGLVFALVAGVVTLDNRASAIALTETYVSFSGACEVDCTGTASGFLTLQNYVLGDTLTTANFVSFGYYSDFTNFSILNGDAGLFLAGSIDGYGTNFVEIGNDTHYFTSDLNGIWCVDTGICTSFLNDDAGVEGVWNEGVPSVPEPGSLGLGAVGLAALGWIARRRQQARISSALQ